MSLGTPYDYLRAPPPPPSPDFAGIQKLVRQATRSSRVVVQQVERLQNTLHRKYVLRMTDGSSLLLKCPPSNSTRILRHEQQNLSTEAEILSLLATNAPHIPIPRLLKQDQSCRSIIDSPYVLRSHLRGTSLDTISTNITSEERRQIDRTIGMRLRTISMLTAPSYGPSPRVLAGTGYPTWRQAFTSMLEAILQDAEDMLVLVPYVAVRSEVARHASVLDEVVEAKLVPMDVGTERNVLIDERSKEVVGLLSWGGCVWGDPYLATVFGEDWVGEAFWEGWGECPARIGSVQVRHLLYLVYRSVLSVITQYIRPELGGDELEARRTLMRALSQLSMF
ncbi:hypothetical protein M501DRAFT_941064 [Patellaria atrata CBS 101060]|uniref:Aminoglycoside phosphotransferase domain-containing protein n=1 Tax=Patellaria atrata CBS 101060 TaxID=1346257 RepID=A0A9P4VNK7_9PEZI|nr:hypothetical protein M501DRAFT_941064 [Patellaria atrata CBS 101060]